MKQLKVKHEPQTPSASIAARPEAKRQKFQLVHIWMNRTWNGRRDIDGDTRNRRRDSDKRDEDTGVKNRNTEDKTDLYRKQGDIEET